MANYFQIFPPLVFSYRLFIFTNRRNFQVRTWVWRKFAASIFKEGIGQESNGAANQEKQIFLLCQISPSASSIRDLETRLTHPPSFHLHWSFDFTPRKNKIFTPKRGKSKCQHTSLFRIHLRSKAQTQLPSQKWLFNPPPPHLPDRFPRPSVIGGRVADKMEFPNTAFAQI